jgi:hypothetical protein
VEGAVVVASAEVDQPQASADEVAGCASAAMWSVQEQGWADVAPTLSEDAIALLAPPVVVSAESCDVGLTARPRYAR